MPGNLDVLCKGLLGDMSLYEVRKRKPAVISPDKLQENDSLNVFIATMLRIQQWMCNKQKMNPFVRAMKSHFQSIDKLKLLWMKTLEYKAGKFGGWVSENYLGISRLLKWFYFTSLDLIASDTAPWIEPNKHSDKWSMV